MCLAALAQDYTDVLNVVRSTNLTFILIVHAVLVDDTGQGSPDVSVQSTNVPFKCISINPPLQGKGHGVCEDDIFG